MRVEMLPDDIDDIVATVHRLKARVGEQGAIITSGGIGPTHDDVRAHLDRKLVYTGSWLVVWRRPMQFLMPGLTFCAGNI